MTNDCIQCKAVSLCVGEEAEIWWQTVPRAVWRLFADNVSPLFVFILFSSVLIVLPHAAVPQEWVELESH